MNRYLEKAASIGQFFSDLTGRDVKDLTARKFHLERALANNDTVRGLGRKIKVAQNRSMKTRLLTGGAALATAGVGVVGTKMYTDRENEKSRQNLVHILGLDKKASALGEIGNIAREAGKRTYERTKPGVIGAIKDTAKGALDTWNTALGGKVRQFALDNIGDKKSGGFKAFMNNTPQNRESTMDWLGRHDKLQELRVLHQKQRAARVGIGGSVAAVGGAYLYGKRNGRNEVLNSYY